MKLQPALITSFNVLRSLATPGISMDDVRWPSREHGPAIHADIYMMMETDVIAWNREFNRNVSNPSAVELMSSITSSQVSQIATTIQSNAEAKGVTVASLTSFFPSLSLSRDHEEQNHFHVIANLMRIALRLGDAFGRVPVIQMVAGSLISNIATGEYKGSDVLLAECGDREAMFNLVLDRIEKATEDLKNDSEFSESPLADLRIAFELEPGPIYLFNDLESLGLICDEIEKRNDEVSRMVGFNLDIPHWWIAENIDPSWIRSSDDLAVRVRERVFHAHIAGHSERGHFGDMSLRRMPPRQIEIFQEWLDAVSELDQVDFVSLEMEAARSFAEVDESIDTLLEWLGATAISS